MTPYLENETVVKDLATQWRMYRMYQIMDDKIGGYHVEIGECLNSIEEQITKLARHYDVADALEGAAEDAEDKIQQLRDDHARVRSALTALENKHAALRRLP